MTPATSNRFNLALRLLILALAAIWLIFPPSIP